MCVFGKAHRSLAFATSFCVFDGQLIAFEHFCNELLLVLDPHFHQKKATQRRLKMSSQYRAEEEEEEDDDASGVSGNGEER